MNKTKESENKKYLCAIEQEWDVIAKTKEQAKKIFLSELSVTDIMCYLVDERISKEKLKEIKQMEKRVIEEITEPERFLE